MFGLAVMLTVRLINYQVLLENPHWFYIASVVSLLAVTFFGKKDLGAKRWIQLPGGQHFQPSEWVKLVLILMLAKYFSGEGEREASLSDIVKAGLIAGIPMLLVLKQPDLGTALTYVPVALMGLFLGGIQFRHAAAILLIVGVLMPGVWHYGLKPYQKDRLTTFLHPEVDGKGSGYQLRHVGESSAEIRLLQDQKHGHAGNQTGLYDVRQRSLAFTLTAEIFGQHENQNKLDPFRRLEALRA